MAEVGLPVVKFDTTLGAALIGFGASSVYAPGMNSNVETFADIFSASTECSALKYGDISTYHSTN
jgi:hypothetical protein